MSKVVNIENELFKKAVYLYNKREYKEALKYFSHLMRKYKKVEYKLALANSLRNLKRYKEALIVYKQAILQTPNNCEIYYNVGITFEEIQRLKEAVSAYKDCLLKNPKHLKALNNLGGVFYKLQQYNKAILIFQEALKLKTDYFELYSNIGSCYSKLKMYEKAEKFHKISIKNSPKSSGAYTNLGNVYNNIYKYKDAIILHKKSIKLDPFGANSYANLANSLKHIGRFGEAIKCYKKAIELDANFVNAHFDLATTYLMLGDFKNGFREYEWRFIKPQMKSHISKYKDIFKTPKVRKGLNLKNKKVLIHTEQGFGDSIQFARFVESFTERFGSQVILQCRDELKTLFENSLKNVDIFYARESEKTPKFDYQISMLSLPYLYEVNTLEDIPYKTKPYLFAKKETLMQIKKDKDKVYIGICWGASNTGESYDGKVFKLNYFKPIILNDKFVIYSLQVGEDSKQICEYGFEEKIIDMTDKLSDFSKTASLIEQLDLVISSDTSVAHLSGALGKETWVPLQKVPDWRYRYKDRVSYLYPNMKLFRQKSFQKWDSVFDSIVDKLSFKYKTKIDKG